MGKYFKNKTCIYLDQFAVSGLNMNDAWKDIADLVNEGIIKEKLCVLYSIEHVLGHGNIKTTQVYLDSLSSNTLDDLHEKILKNI